MKAQDCLFVYCMVPNQKTGEAIARHLLSTKLIACANLLPPAQTFYEWKGEFQNKQEYALILKTKKTLYQKMSTELIKKHPYECPGLCAFPLSHAFQPYLNWIQQSLS